MIATPTPAATPTALDTLSAEFSRWRATRKSRRTPVPRSLRTQAIDLLASNRTSHVIRALGINHTMLKSWQSPPEATPTTPFIPVSIETLPPASALVFTVTYSQGHAVTLQGEFSLSQLTALAQGLQPKVEVDA